MSNVDWFDPAVIQAHQPGRVRREQIAQTARIQKENEVENARQRSHRFHNAVHNENIRLGVTENNERNEESLKDFMKFSKAKHDWNYRKIREKKEKEGMGKNDIDAGRNHPEDHLTVTEPLAPTNTNLDASLPRKRNRTGHRVGNRPVPDKFLQGYHNSGIPDDVRKIVKSYIKPGREPMTSLEAIRFHNKGNRHHEEKKTMRREVVPRQVAGDPEEVKFRYSRFNNFKNKLNKTGRGATFTEF